MDKLLKTKRDLIKDYNLLPAQENGIYSNISETIDLLTKEGFEVTQQQIRKYETIGLIVPAKKSKSKYRFYSRGNIDQLRTILALRIINIPIKKIKRYFELSTRLKDFVDKYIHIRNKEHITETRLVSLFSDEVIREEFHPMLNLNLVEFDEQKFKLNNEDARGALIKTLSTAQEMLDIVYECISRLQQLKIIAGKFEGLFNKQEINLVGVIKKIEGASSSI